MPSVRNYDCCNAQSPDKSSQQQEGIVQYLIDIVDLVENPYPDCGVANLGVFKQVVKCAMQRSPILDLIQGVPQETYTV